MARVSRKAALTLWLVILARPVQAQQAVEPISDWVSYGTAAVNPSIAVVKALRAEHPVCALSKLGLSELIGNGAALTMKHFVVSPRPCVGCASDGMPSAHTMNSVIGLSSSWRVGLWFSVGTAEARTFAHRHTPWQVLAGGALGGLSEWIGQKALRCAS